MKRQINWIRHLGILFLTITIFVVGVLIGGDVEQLRVQNLYTQLQEQDLDYQRIVTESFYLDYLISNKEEGANVSCEMIRGAYFTSIDNLEQSRLKLENYINEANTQEEQYQRLRGHYANLQINYWVMAERIKESCNGNLNTILYFYSQDEEVCPECEDQGVHLTYVKQRLGDEVLIFSFDFTQRGAVQLLAQNYDVFSRSLPVVVINGEVYNYITNQEIFTILLEQ